MAVAIGSNPYSANTAGATYGQAAAPAKTTDASAPDADTASTRSTSDSVDLSDAAKAYIAGSSSTDTTSTASDTAALAAKARAWFDQQYQTLNIGSALLDGQVAVDLTGQSRETLSAVASNSQGLFSTDESAAATQTLQARFNDAIAPHVVIARHTGDYASRYQAASDYLDQAGAVERATPAWQDQKQAVLDGLAAAKKTFGKAPATGNAKDPVRALLDKTAQSAAPTTATDSNGMATNAHAKFDAQANQASDAGTDLTFDPSRKSGQQVDLSKFNNQTLAVVSLNQDSSFSAAEVFAAKTELNQRNRTNILNAIDPTKNGGTRQGASLALLQQYASMSDVEKTALGYTDDYKNRLVQNYRTMSNLEANSASTGSSVLGLMSYL